MHEACFYRISIKGLVKDGSRILLAREKSGRWDLLGGGLEHGEDPKAALVRQISEETSLKVTSVSDQPIYFITAPSPKEGVFVANVIYEITLENFDFTPSAECQELRLLAPVEMHALDLLPNVAKLLTVLERKYA